MNAKDNLEAPPESPQAYPLERAIENAIWGKPGNWQSVESGRDTSLHSSVPPHLNAPSERPTSAASIQDDDTVHGALVCESPSRLDSDAHAHAKTATEPEPGTLTMDEALAPLRPWQQRFIRALVTHGGIVELACRAGNVSRSSAFEWKARDTVFAQLWNDASAGADDLIEASLYVSAVHGNLQPIYQGGVLAGYKRVKDVKAAELLLKARRPEVYAPEQVVRIKGEAKVTVVSPSEVPAIVGDVIKALFAARAEQMEARRPVLDV